jgi:hypothetical protein
MPFLRLHKANEAGEAVGTVIINTDLIVAAHDTGLGSTELQMADGRPRWVKESLTDLSPPLSPLLEIPSLKAQ